MILKTIGLDLDDTEEGIEDMEKEEGLKASRSKKQQLKIMQRLLMMLMRQNLINLYLQGQTH